MFEKFKRILSRKPNIVKWAERFEQKSKKFYDQIYNNYSRYLVIPLGLIVVALGILSFNLYTTGEFLEKGMDFEGGAEITFQMNQSFSQSEIENIYSEAGWTGTTALTQDPDEEGLLIVRIPDQNVTEDEALEVLKSNGYSSATASEFRKISGAVSSQFLRQAQFAFVLAFTIMSFVIFVAFKNFTPSIAVVFAAAGDIIIAAAGMSLMGVQLTLGSLAALLMLIGYSVDTDILLSSRVLKMNRGSVQSRMWNSVKTGLTMSSGGIAGFTLLYIVSVLLVGPSTLSNIAAVMVIGLMADIPLTWIGNTYILKKYVEGDFEKLEKYEKKVKVWR
jgi:preprotein translocase subunit SecF